MKKENPLFAHAEHKGYDYKQPGFYGITLCTYHRRWLFGRVANGQMHLSETGLLAQTVWKDFSQRWPSVRLDEYIFMPNHTHMLIELVEAHDHKQISVFEVIRAYKACASYTIRQSVGEHWLGWQEGAWKTVFTSEAHLAYARQYIANNPASWTSDRLMREEFRQHEIRRSRLKQA